MQKKWVKHLVDPIDKKPLQLKIKKMKAEDISEGKLFSLDNSHEYPIINGVPRFVSEELYKETPLTRTDLNQTSNSFGNKWRKNVNIWNNEPMIKRCEKIFINLMGVKNRDELKNLFKGGLNSLNAGCGVAWNEFLFNFNRKVNRFAIDISLSIEVAYEKTNGIENVCISQANLFDLPFKKDFFDIIYSNGVLHHTGDAEKAFKVLCTHLKPGGIIGIYIYCVKPFLRELADEEIRKVTTKMNFNDCWKFSEEIAHFGKSLQKYKEPLIIEYDIPFLNIKRGKYNLQKFIYDHFIKCYYNETLGCYFSTLTNLDWYHPSYASHHTRDEIELWFEKNRIIDVEFNQPKGWEYSGYFVSGRKST